MDLWLIFLTGLTVGGLTCLAVQGGLLASVIAGREKERLGEGGGRKRLGGGRRFRFQNTYHGYNMWVTMDESGVQ